MSLEDKDVLIISYTFVPNNISGVFRILRLSNYLPGYGWTPHILTIKESAGMRNIDRDLYSRINPLVKVYRTSTIDPQLLFFKYAKKHILRENKEDVGPELCKNSSRVIARSEATKQSDLKGRCEPEGRGNLMRFFSSFRMTFRVRFRSSLSNLRGRFLRFFFFPDPQILWLPFALLTGYRAIKRQDIEVIFATSIPWTNYIVGYCLSLMTKRPFILDFRDTWTSNEVVGFSTALHKAAAGKLEKFLIRRASMVISVTEMITQGFIKSFPGMADKFITITNGFDPQLLGEAAKERVTPDNRKFRMVYAGTFYAKRKPETFLRALYELLKEYPEMKNEMEFRFIGNDYQGALYETVDSLSLFDIIKMKGFLSYGETHMELQKADIVLLIIPPEYKEEYTGKVFEYFTARKPILAIVPRDGMAAGLIERTKTGVVASVEDIDEIKKAVRDYFLQWKNGSITYERDESEVEKYDMKILTGKLAAVLNSWYDIY